MRLTSSRVYYRPTPPKMPPGLVELIEGLTRDVLKNNPRNVYEFCASHMQQLLEKRDGPRRTTSLTLQEKIAKACENVRQRAEVRKQQYDNELLLKKGNKIVIKKNDTLNEDDIPSVSLQEPIFVNTLKTTIFHEQELLKSSEVEISQKDDTENYTLSESPQYDNRDKAMQVNYVLNDEINTEVGLTEVQPQNESDMESTNHTNHKHIITKDVCLYKLPKTDPSITKIHALKKEHSVHDTNFNSVSESLVNEQTPHCGEQSLNENDDILSHNSGTQGFNEVTSQHLSNPVDSMIVNPKCLVVYSNEKTIKDSAQVEVEKITDNCNLYKDTSIKPDEQDTKVVDVITKGVAESQNDTFYQSNNIEGTQKSNYSDEKQPSFDAEIINHSTDIKSFEQATNGQHIATENNEANKDSKTVDFCFKESPSIELQDSFISSNMLELLPAVSVDNNIATFSTLDSSNEMMQLIAFKNEDSDTVEPVVITEIPIVDNEKTESNMSISDDELHKNTCQNHQINTIDLSEKSIFVSVDNNIATFSTLDSSNEMMQLIAFKNEDSDAVEPVVITEIPIVDNEKTESNMSISDDELHKNTWQNHQINTIDLSEKSIFVSNTEYINENCDINSSKRGTSIKLIESSQSSQDTGGMDLETAAITIQKVFRTFLFKSRASTFDDITNDETIFFDEGDKNKEECDFPVAGAVNIERRPHGITRMDTVLQTVNEEKSLSLSTDDSSLSSAATVIQAHVRGFLVRNKLNSNKTVSTNSLAASYSNEPSLTSLEMDNDQHKNKTVLNIHIVPEGGNYLSRDESLITSMDLSLDGSPPSSINLHPLGYDKSERRKQLKREDAIQSISPPSNNSVKLSEDVDSMKELPLNDQVITENQAKHNNSIKDDLHEDNVKIVEGIILETVLNSNEVTGDIKGDIDNLEKNSQQIRKSLKEISSDEMDVVTPFISNKETNSSDLKLLHSGEFHDAVLPTKVSRSDTSVASEFKNVLVYFLLWNHS